MLAALGCQSIIWATASDGFFVTCWNFFGRFLFLVGSPFVFPLIGLLQGKEEEVGGHSDLQNLSSQVTITREGALLSPHG